MDRTDRPHRPIRAERVIQKIALERPKKIMNEVNHFFCTGQSVQTDKITEQRGLKRPTYFNVSRPHLSQYFHEIFLLIS